MDSVLQKRFELFAEALGLCNGLLLEFPGRQALLSIREQLLYLMAVVRDERAADRLGEITIGVLTAREVEPLSEVAAGVFYKVSAEARDMQSQGKGDGLEYP